MVSHVTAAGGDDHRPPEFRVFIASTFRDIQPSHEHLLRTVFPELRGLCGDRRLGFSTSTFYLNSDVAVHLNDIIIGRPFFLGIFNDEPEDAHDEERDKVIELAEQVLKNLTMTDRAAFYVHRRSERSAGAPNRRLQMLIERGRLCGVPVRGPFAEPEQLGASIAIDLRSALERLHPIGARRSWLEHERHIHEGIAASRRLYYQEDPRMIERLDDVAGGVAGPIVISGEPGVGKTALLAYWSDRYRAAHPDAVVIEHYIGGASARDHQAIVRRIVGEIKLRYDADKNGPSTAADGEESLSAWLAQVQGRPLVLVLDALDRLGEESRRLDWLPDYIQPNVRLIVSSLEGPALDALRERDWPVHEVLPLSSAQRLAIMRRVIDDSSYALDSDMMNRLVDDSRFANPLFLWVGLEELTARKQLGKLYDRIDYYLGAGGLDELFERALEEREKVFSRAVVRDVMAALWTSRRGLSIDELRAICASHGDHLPALLHSLHYSLMEQGGRLTFFHDSLRDVVGARYIRGDLRRRARVRVAEYFAGLPISVRMADEILWQLREAGDWEGLARWVERLDLLLELVRSENEHELLQYWLEVEDRFGLDMADLYCRQLYAIDPATTSPADRFMIHFDVARFLLVAGRREAARELLDVSHAWFDELGPEMIAEKIRHLNMLGEIHQAESEFARAAELYDDAMKLCRTHFPMGIGQTTNTLHNMAALKLKEGKLDEAIELFTSVVELQKRLPDIGRQELAGGRNDLGTAWYAAGNAQRAEACFNEALRAVESVCGADHPARIEVLNNLGAIALANYEENTAGGKLDDARNELDKAEAIFTEALRVGERGFGPRSSVTIIYLNNLALVKNRRGEFEEAKKLYLRVLDIGRRNRMRDSVANALISLGSLYRATRQYPEAEEALKEAFEIRRSLLGDRHIDSVKAALNLGSLYKECGDLKRGYKLYSDNWELLVAGLGREHALVRRVVVGYVELLEMMGLKEDAARIRAMFPEFFPS